MIDIFPINTFMHHSDSLLQGFARSDIHISLQNECTWHGISKPQGSVKAQLVMEVITNYNVFV